MAEWSNAAVLKTVEGQLSGGSNPSLSAKNQRVSKKLTLFYFEKIERKIRILGINLDQYLDHFLVLVIMLSINCLQIKIVTLSFINILNYLLIGNHILKLNFSPPSKSIHKKSASGDTW